MGPFFHYGVDDPKAVEVYSIMEKRMEQFVASVWVASQPGGATPTTIQTRLQEVYKILTETSEVDVSYGGLDGEYAHLVSGEVTNDLFRSHLTVRDGMVIPHDNSPEKYLSTELKDVLEEVCGAWY